MYYPSQPFISCITKGFVLTRIRAIVIASLLYDNRMVNVVELHELQPFLFSYYSVSVTIK